jgi:hypothetical protein
MSETKSPLKSIRAYCLGCCCESAHEVKECTFTKCELYPYRLGHAVNRAKRELTDEQRQILRQRMAAMRNTVK